MLKRVKARGSYQQKAIICCKSTKLELLVVMSTKVTQMACESLSQQLRLTHRE